MFADSDEGVGHDAFVDFVEEHFFAKNPLFKGRVDFRTALDYVINEIK